MKHLFPALLFSLLSAVAARAADIAPTWTLVAPGVWKATAGSPEDYDLLSAAGAEPATDALAKMPSAVFPLDKEQIHSHVTIGRTALQFPLASDEDIYGLGVDFKVMRRTGSTFQLHEDHWSGQTGRTHAPVPFYVSSKGYGVLIDSARYITVNIGLAVRLAAKDKPPVYDRTTESGKWAANPRSDTVDILIPSPGTDIYVFAGPTPMDAVRRYNLFCGGGALPPKWGLGFLARTPLAYSADQVAAEVAIYRKQGIPLDMIGLEPGWQSRSYPGSFEWDKTRFPEPAKFLADMQQQKIHINLWFDPYIAPKSNLGKAMLPYAGSDLVWNGLVPDYSMPEARKAFGDFLLKETIALSPVISGFKIDEVDGLDQWLWPDQASFPSGHDGEQLRQTYGLQLQKLVYNLYHDRNQRTYGQVRGTNAGASRLPFVIYNDNYDFNEYITAVGNTAFAGVLWSPEVRGGPGEDMLRRTQAVCFSPLALFNGWSTDTKLWSDPQFTGPIREAILLRHRLLPYWYNTFAEYHYQGTPIIRPMPLIENAPTTVEQATGKLDPTRSPDAITHPDEITDQYMVGDFLLVAPIAPGVKSRTVVLPPGQWFDFYTGKSVGDSTIITVTPPLNQIPLFVKDGGIIPMIPKGQYAPAVDERLPLEIRHYGTAPSSADIYDDDGTTFNYEKGDGSWTHVSAKKDMTGAWVGTIPNPDTTKWNYSDVKWVFMSQ